MPKLPILSGNFLQVSGITFDLNSNFNSTVFVDDLGMFVNVTEKRRVSNVKINGVDLKSDKLYNASLNKYIANGGDGYSMFSKLIYIMNLLLLIMML